MPLSQKVWDKNNKQKPNKKIKETVKQKQKWQEKVWIKKLFVASGILSMPPIRVFFCQRTCQRIVNYTLTIPVTIPCILEMSVACYTHFLDSNLSTRDRPNLYSSTLKSVFVANILSMPAKSLFIHTKECVCCQYFVNAGNFTSFSPPYL